MTKHISREELEQLYCTEHLPVEEVSSRLGISLPTLYERIRRFGLFRSRIRSMSEENAEIAFLAYTKEGKTLRQISLQLHTDPRKVAKALRERGVTVDNVESHKIKTNYRLPEVLRELYIDQELSTVEIARLAGVQPTTVRQWLEGAGIERRDLESAGEVIVRKGKRTGEKNPSWRGGKTRSWQGYMLIKMPGHPLADERGYVKEHVLVATGGDPDKLKPGTIVHHIDLDKSNNSPENLTLIRDRKAHQLAHYELECLAAELVKSGDIVFEDGHYRFSETFTNTRSKVDIVNLS